MPRPNTGPKLQRIKGRDQLYIVWYEGGQRRVRSTGTSDSARAAEELAGFIGQRRPVSGPAEPRAVKVTDALSLYAGDRTPKVADPQRLLFAIEPMIQFWSGYTLDQITPALCDDYAAARGKAPGTIRKELGTLTAAQNFMIRDQRLTRAVPVPLPAKPEPKDRWLTVSEAAALLNAARGAGRDGRQYLPLFVMIGLYTGARKEAILSLRWPQVNLQTARLTFAIPGRVRTKKRRPTLPIPRRLMPFLRYAWLRRSSDLGTVLHIDGSPIKRIDKGFRAAAARAGLPGVSPHTLRHTRGTWLAQQGVPMWDIAGWLGQDIETTTRIYAHHHPDFMAAALDAVDRRR